MADKLLNTIERKEFESGDVEFYRNGVLHNADGPAVDKANGARYWYKNGVLHRIGGPAVYNPSGRNQYFIDGKQYTEEEYLNEHQFKKELTITISGWAGSGKTMMAHYLHKKLTYGGFACKNNDLEMSADKMINIDQIINEMKDQVSITINTQMAKRQSGTTQS